ncbi:MAG: helix-turn-helix domain-containing protein [Reyranellales bacterium]
MANDALLSSVDWALRGGTTAVVLLLAGALVREHRDLVSARLGAAFALGTGAYAVTSAAGFSAHLGWWTIPLLALSAGNNVVFWTFTASLFDDGFRMRWWHPALWLLLVVAGVAMCLRPNQPLGLALTLSSFTFALLAMAQAVASWRVDLVEGRRRLRLFVVAASSLYIGLNAVAQFFGVPRAAPAGASLAGACGLLAIAGVIAWSLLRIGSSQSLFVSRPSEVSAVPAPGPTPLPTDQGLVAALERLMTVERAYRQDGLTIGALAQKLDLPEYRLRRLINQALGYRNFNSFLNYYRISEAKTALADASQAGVPVLTIALDAGFSSLGPFNRAFKAETGMTPSEFRRLEAANSGIGEPISVSASPNSNSARRISTAP